MSSTIQHRYNLRSTAKRAMNYQPVTIVKKEPIIKISIFMYLLNMIAYFLETFSTPEVYKNMFKRQSEQDAINMQQEQEQVTEQNQQEVCRGKLGDCGEGRAIRPAEPECEKKYGQ